MFEDRKAQIAVFLSFIVIVIYSELVLKPKQVPQQAQQIQQQQQVPQQSIEKNSEGWSLPPAQTSATDISQPIVPSDTSLPASTAQIEGEKEAVNPQGSTQRELATLPSHIPTISDYRGGKVFTVESPLYRAEIPALGAGLLSFRLKQYSKERDSKEPLDMIYPADRIPLPLSLQVGNFADYSLPYHLADDNLNENALTVQPGQTLRIPFEATLPDGTTIKKIYQFVPGSYLFDVEVLLSKPSNDASPVQLVWTGQIPDEVVKSSYDPLSFVVLDSDDDVENLQLSRLEEQEIKRFQAHWVSLGDKYFMASLIDPQGSAGAILTKRKDVYTSALAGKPTTGSFKVFIGPKEYNGLKAIGFSLHRSVNLGIFSFLAHPLLMLMNVFYGFLGNYGLSIILLTLFIKSLFLPLTKVSFKSMKAMQDLQPEIKALRERIKDPTELNKEMLTLYKKRGVNPMGGCLPMLIQLPVFLGLYNALQYATELRHAEFALWINDLSAPEGLHVFGVGVPVMLLLMGISMFLQQYLTPTAMDPQQRKVMLMMPVIFTGMFIVFPFPSGLVLYWLVNNLISIVQQVYLRSDKYAHPGRATAIASIAIFSFGYVLTLL